MKLKIDGIEIESDNVEDLVEFTKRYKGKGNTEPERQDEPKPVPEPKPTVVYVHKKKSSKHIINWTDEMKDELLSLGKRSDNRRGYKAFSRKYKSVGVTIDRATSQYHNLVQHKYKPKKKYSGKVLINVSWTDEMKDELMGLGNYDDNHSKFVEFTNKYKDSGMTVNRAKSMSYYISHYHKKKQTSEPESDVKGMIRNKPLVPHSFDKFKEMIASRSVHQEEFPKLININGGFQTILVGIMKRMVDNKDLVMNYGVEGRMLGMNTQGEWQSFLVDVLKNNNELKSYFNAKGKFYIGINNTLRYG